VGLQIHEARPDASAALPMRDVPVDWRPLRADDPSATMLHDSLDTLIRLIERVSPGMRGSVLLLDDDGITLRHGAAPNLPIEYCRAIDGAHIGPADGSCGTAAYRRERVIVRDIATDPLWDRYRAIAQPHGLAACWSTPILDADGHVLGTFAMYYDEPRDPTPIDIALTETATLLAKNIVLRARTTAALRARTEATERWALALHESEARFRMMAETIPVQVWTAQPDGKLDFVTRRTAEGFGKTVEQLLADGWLDVVHPDDVDRVIARWTLALQTGEPYETQFRLRSRDGEYRWHLVRAHAMCDDDGHVQHWFGCNADIEEHKRLEGALDAALTDAKEANRTKAAFLAMMSHELRTPLNAIGGYTDLMIDGIPVPAAEPHVGYLRRISDSQKHLLGLIEAVLTHAKLEAGKIVYHTSNVAAFEVLDVVDSLTAPQRTAKSLAFLTDDCDRRMTFSADREKLVQILLNLVSNAAKFTPEGGTITVRTETTPAGMGALIVRDTGVGMSADELALVFEPYVQFDNRLSREQKGTGLGMPIARELARGMGGDMTATSEVGVGTEVRVEIPLA